MAIQGMTGFFEETPGQKSMMRLMSFMCLCFAFFVVTYILLADTRALWYGKEAIGFDQNMTWVLALLLGAAFCPKVIQKLIEMKFSLPSDKANP